jgi:beta-lactam-binding protein with PASTA domain
MNEMADAGSASKMEHSTTPPPEVVLQMVSSLALTMLGEVLGSSLTGRLLAGALGALLGTFLTARGSHHKRRIVAVVLLLALLDAARALAATLTRSAGTHSTRRGERVPWRPMLTIAAGVAGFSVGTGIVAVAGGFPSGNGVSIPGVIGRDPSKATAILAAADLKATIRYEAGLDAADRRVRAQSPSPGEKEPRGSTVVLTVAARSTGPVLVRVPNVEGVSVEVADAKLRDSHLTPGEKTVSEPSGTVPSGEVIGSTPAAGASVKESSTVALEVSTGAPRLVLVRVPNVEGVSVGVADEELRASHLTPGEATVRESSGTVPSGEVIGSTPAAGASVKESSTVALKVSTGPESN